MGSRKNFIVAGTWDRAWGGSHYKIKSISFGDPSFSIHIRIRTSLNKYIFISVQVSLMFVQIEMNSSFQHQSFPINKRES